MKKNLNERNQVHNFILCVCENSCDPILSRFRNRNQLRFRFGLFDKLRNRFRFHTAKSSGSYGSGSTTLLETRYISYEIAHQYLEHSLYLADDTLVHRAEGADMPVRQEVVPQQGRVNQNLRAKKQKAAFFICLKEQKNSPQGTKEWFKTVHTPQSDTITIIVQYRTAVLVYQYVHVRKLLLCFLEQEPKGCGIFMKVFKFKVLWFLLFVTALIVLKKLRFIVIFKFTLPWHLLFVFALIVQREKI